MLETLSSGVDATTPPLAESSVIVKRVPARAAAPKLHQPLGKAYRNHNEPVRGTSKATPNLAEANAAEEDKIKAMMIQSCCYYEPLKKQHPQPRSPAGMEPPKKKVKKADKPA
ncbi:E3 ubiquitin-protein ligase RBBP6-like isoform X5 [Passer domesticus]|uniref:E3 ubiquitin-protein ligase RBBP6-like isoform X5 n=1 Tax=Passer domesticus TaxID=48849 RepID=UPI0030FECAEE